MLTTNPKGDEHWYGDEDNLPACAINGDTSMVNFNLKSDYKTLEDKCENLDASESSCETSYNRRYNLSPETHDGNRRRMARCEVQGHIFGLPGCGQKSECVLPKGDNNSSDNYAKLGTKGGVTLSFAPCYENRFPRQSGIYLRMKNPDTMDGSHQAWSSASNVCNTGGLDPNNEKCKRFDDFLSCERRGWKEDCEKVEAGCSMYEGGSCCSWDPSQEIGKRCSKNTNGCNRHTTLAECNSNPSKMCRWGPDEENSIDNRKPGCYTNKGFQDSYLNTMDNTCRSPHFFDKNLVWTRTGEETPDGYSKCKLIHIPTGPTSERFFFNREECEGKLVPKPTPDKDQFACLNMGSGKECTKLAPNTKISGSFPSLAECQLGTNYCGNGEPVKRFGCLNMGSGISCNQIPTGQPFSPSFPTKDACQKGTDYCGKGPP